ncbi:DsbA family oxidoreductase [Exilibacterium tricleocarpae]|uniref:DsbA family oxidoreductase n=1 Tax=Exilibacterium tricleocarpae TaxID=2591008 RepID=A0A545T0Q6_9GAMM|nr:DsbA family oxidoreductase [Exilibacterium tricleocarpae]TQV70780.1 DsbA family oxidoreductase [Exilibacterium tricleocarpae]
MDKPKDNVNITFTSDFICPWCFVAERRLRAVAKDSGISLSVSYQPYELNPTMPAAGINRKIYRSTKFGSWEKSMALDAGTIEAAAEDPVEFNYDKILTTPNTRNAHRLVWFVGRHFPETLPDLVDRMFEGYFSSGIDIGNIDALATLAAKVGLDHDAVLALLRSDEGTKELIALEREAIDKGVRGVPHIQIGDAYLYGAESAERMRLALQAAANS